MTFFIHTFAAYAVTAEVLLSVYELDNFSKFATKIAAVC